MTQYQNKTFSVQMGGRKADECRHQWIQCPSGRCVMCGENPGLDAIRAVTEKWRPAMEALRERRTRGE